MSQFIRGTLVINYDQPLPRTRFETNEYCRYGEIISTTHGTLTIGKPTDANTGQNYAYLVTSGN